MNVVDFSSDVLDPLVRLTEGKAPAGRTRSRSDATTTDQLGLLDKDSGPADGARLDLADGSALEVVGIVETSDMSQRGAHDRRRPGESTPNERRPRGSTGAAGRPPRPHLGPAARPRRRPGRRGSDDASPRSVLTPGLELDTVEALNVAPVRWGRCASSSG